MDMPNVIFIFSECLRRTIETVICLLFSIFDSMLNYAPQASVLLVFLSIQFVALSTGYPLIFYVLGLVSDERHSRFLREQFSHDPCIWSLKTFSFVGILCTGICVLTHNFYSCSVLWKTSALFAACLFFVTSILLLLVLNRLLKYIQTPYLIALETEMDRVIRKLQKQSLLGGCLIGRQVDIDEVISEYRKGLVLITEQISALTEYPWQENKQKELAEKFIKALDRDRLATLAIPRNKIDKGLM